MSAYFVLATEALGRRQWLGGVMPTDFGDATCLANVIFGALEFDTREEAQQCLADLDLTGFEIVPCEFGMSRSLSRAIGARK